MTMNTQTIDALDDALKTAIDASQAFEPVLADEQTALKAGDLTLLSSVLERKSVLTTELLSASEALLDWCSKQGIEPDYNAFSDWCSPLPADQSGLFLNLWTQLKTNLDRNSRSTAVNRQILASLSAQNQARLTLLKNLVGAPNTYSAAGTQSPSDGQHRWVDQV